MPKLTPEELLGLAMAGFKLLKSETNNNAEMFATLAIVNALISADAAAAKPIDDWWSDEKG